MTISRASALAALAAFMFLIAGSASAQTVVIEPETTSTTQPLVIPELGQPVEPLPELLVPQSLEPVLDDVNLVPPSGTGNDKWAPSDQPVGSIGLGDDSIEIDQLTIVSADSIGLLNERGRRASLYRVAGNTIRNRI